MLILHGYKDLKTEGFWSYDLDRLGSCDVISHMTISLALCLTNRWSIIAIRVSFMVTEVWSIKYFGVMTLTF